MTRYFAVPNSLVTSSRLTASELAVATYLFSLIHPSRTNTFGFWVKAKQTTISARCGISTKTVSRAVEKLIELGIISQKIRTVKANRHLSTYIYVLKCPKKNGRYFYCDSKIVRLLSRKTLRTYLLCCKCASSKRSFFKSYTDLSKLIGINRSEAIRAVRELAELGILSVKKRLTKLGDYTENLYFLCMFKKTFRTKKFPAPPKANARNNSNFIMTYYLGFVKGFLKKSSKKLKFYYFLRGGGVKNVRSILRYPLYKPIRDKK